MSTRMSVLETVKELPSSCHDIADELDIHNLTASTLLSQLFREGKIKRKMRLTNQDSFHKCWLYYI